MEALQSAAFGSRSVREAEGMQREREGLQVAPIRVVRLFPARHLGLPRLHPRLGRWVIMLHVGLPLASCQSLLGLLELPLRLSEARTLQDGWRNDQARDCSERTIFANKGQACLRASLDILPERE